MSFCRSAVLPIVAIAGVAGVPATALAQREADFAIREKETPEHLRVAGRIFLQMTPEARDNGAGEQFVQTMTRMFEGRVLRRYNTLLPGMVLLDVPVGHERMIAEIAQQSREIESIAWDTWGKPAATPNDPRAVNGEMWWRTSVCIDPVWDAGITDASDVVVAVIDTGVNYLHPDLAPNMWKNQAELNGAFNLDDDGNGITDDVDGAAFFWPDWSTPPSCYNDFSGNFLFCNQGNECNLAPPCEPGSNPELWLGIGNDPMDRDIIQNGGEGACICDPINPLWFAGHGTRASAVLGAVGNNSLYAAGTAWQASMMPIRVSDVRWDVYLVSDFIAALDYAAAQGAKVISASMTYAYSPALESAVDNLAAFDVVLVACAGNFNQDIDDTSPPTPLTVPWQYPVGFSSMKHVLGVGATDFNNNRLSNSSWGAQSVDVFAPGIALPALQGSFGNTSGATPIVAGIVALYRDQYPNRTASEVVFEVVSTATVQPSLVPLSVSGGVVNAAAMFGLPCQ